MRNVRSVFEDNGKFYPQVHLNNCCLEYNDHDVCCKIPLKCMNNSEYGKYLFILKNAVNFVTTDFNSL